MGLNGAKWGKRGQIGPNGVKLLSIDDSYFLHNMAKVEKLMTDLRKDEVPKKVEPRRQLQGGLSTSCKCCCHGHCKFSVHTVGVPCRVSALIREARLMSVSQPFMKEICPPLQRSLLD